MSASQTVARAGLDTLIRDALVLAAEAGRSEIVTNLRAALSATGEAPYELDVLAAEVRHRGLPIALSRGERALLLALALQRRPCTREELIELLYPHLDDTSGAAQLKVYVHRVRRRLGDQSVILFASNSYRLGPNVSVDYWRIQDDIVRAVRSARTLDKEGRRHLDEIRLRLLRRNMSWNGDHEWGHSLERRLEALLLDVTAALAEAALAAGDLATGLRFAAEMASLDPCDERGTALAIRAQLQCGDRDAACRELRRYERVLREQLDAEPSPELTALISSRN